MFKVSRDVFELQSWVFASKSEGNKIIFIVFSRKSIIRSPGGSGFNLDFNQFLRIFWKFQVVCFVNHSVRNQKSIYSQTWRHSKAIFCGNSLIVAKQANPLRNSSNKRVTKFRTENFDKFPIFLASLKQNSPSIIVKLLLKLRIKLVIMSLLVSKQQTFKIYYLIEKASVNVQAPKTQTGTFKAPQRTFSQNITKFGIKNKFTFVACCCCVR